MFSVGAGRVHDSAESMVQRGISSDDEDGSIACACHPGSQSFDRARSFALNKIEEESFLFHVAADFFPPFVCAC